MKQIKPNLAIMSAFYSIFDKVRKYEQEPTSFILPRGEIFLKFGYYDNSPIVVISVLTRSDLNWIVLNSGIYHHEMSLEETICEILVARGVPRHHITIEPINMNEYIVSCLLAE